MFGRRLTRAGSLKMLGLALASLAWIFMLCAPLASISIRVDLPPAAKAVTLTSPEWVTLFALPLGVMAAVAAFIALFIALPVWMVVVTARKILRTLPRKRP
jgi:predicted Co/Zn/Cd cation transporter (cation efflux family)